MLPEPAASLTGARVDPRAPREMTLAVLRSMMRWQLWCVSVHTMSDDAQARVRLDARVVAEADDLLAEGAVDEGVRQARQDRLGAASRQRNLIVQRTHTAGRLFRGIMSPRPLRSETRFQTGRSCSSSSNRAMTASASLRSYGRALGGAASGTGSVLACEMAMGAMSLFRALLTSRWYGSSLRSLTWGIEADSGVKLRRCQLLHTDRPRTCTAVVWTLEQRRAVA